MKKTTLIKTMLLLCALVVGSSNLWADPSTAGFDLSSTTTVPLAANASPQTTTITGSADETWNVVITGTWTSSSMQGSAGSKYWQMGAKNAAITSAVFSTSGIAGTITRIVVTCSSYQGKAKVNCTVGGAAFGTQNQSTASWTTVGGVTFNGSASGKIVVTIDNNATGARAAYIQSIAVTYLSGSTPGISLSNSSVDATAAGTDGTINVTYNNIASVDAEVKFYESDGTTAATYDWLAAEINVDNNLHYVIGANKGDARTAYMKVHQKNTEVYSNLITITQAAPVVVTLDFTSNGWEISENPTKTVAATEFSSGGYTITLEGGSGDKEGYYFDSNNIMLGKSGASLTLPAFGFNVSKTKVYGTSGASGSVKFNIFVGDDAVSTEVTSSKVDHEFAIDAEKQGVGTVYVIKVTSSDNMRITKIEVYGNGCEAGLVGNAGWATYVTEDPVTYAEGDAFAVTSVGTSVELTSVTSVPTGTPLLLKGAGQKTAILLDAEPAAITNKLAVSDGTQGNGQYVLANHNSKVGFYKWTGSALASGKVYLPASEVSEARSFIGFDDETTGIANINGEAKTLFNSDFYNIAGQRVALPTKGLYIVNGKKVIIK